MQRLKELLDSILGQTTFDLGTGDMLTPARLRDILERRGWPPDGEMLNARSARPVVSEESISQLSNHLRFLLRDFVDPNNDFIGHAFPAGDIPSMIVLQDKELVGESWDSPVRSFAQSLIKGSTVLGTGRVTQLMSNWLRGDSVQYKTIALLNALPVIEPLALEEGLCIDCLSLSTDKLPANLPHHAGMSAEDYLGRTILVIDSIASPAFFRSQFSQTAQNVRLATKLNVDIATVCLALSLSSNSYVDIGFFWNDYQELEAFSLTNDGGSWGSISGRVKERIFSAHSYSSGPTGVTRIIPRDERQTLEVQPAQFLPIYESLQGRDFDKIRLALTRWTMSKGHDRSKVDKLIDLRIALESLYLQNIGDEKDRGEMRFRLSLYGAWHLGVEYEERKGIRKRLREAYDTASKAVHGGNLKDKTDLQDLVSDAQDLCRRGIIKMLREGYPSDWGDLILGAEYDEKSV